MQSFISRLHATDERTDIARSNSLVMLIENIYSYIQYLFKQFTQTDMAQSTWLDLNKNMLLLLHKYVYFHKGNILVGTFRQILSMNIEIQRVDVQRLSQC